MSYSTEMFCCAWALFILSFLFDRRDVVIRAMYRTIAVVFIALALVGCGTPPPSEWLSDEVEGGEPREMARGIDPELEWLLTAFEVSAATNGASVAEFGQRGALLEMQFDDHTIAGYESDDSASNIAGLCVTHVAPDERVWRSIHFREYLRDDPDSLWRVGYHELTHCLYDVGHWGAPGDLQYWMIGASRRTDDELIERHFFALRAVLGLED